MFNSIHRFRTSAVFLFGLLLCTFTAAQASTSTVVAGQSFTLSVTAAGTAPFSYVWYKDSAALTGVTGSSYSVANIQLVNAGTYYAVVSNSAGSTTSDSMTVTVNAATVAPAITTQPVSQTVTAGNSVTFTAAASGAPVPTYQWKLNGTAISGATSATLSIANAQAANAGSYTVVATNSAGSVTSSAAALTVTAVNTAPTIASISDQVTGPGTATGPLSFVVGDSQTAAGSLTVTGTSSNTALVPAGNIAFGGSGANRTVTLTPAAGQTGTTTLTLTVSDGALTSSTTFHLSVSSLAATTQTVSNPAALAIPLIGPANVYPSNVTVAGMGGTLNAVTVQLNGFSHTWSSDVDVLLVSPSGQKIVLMAKTGTGTTTNATLTFSDTATTLLPTDGALATGVYSPTNYKTGIAFLAPAPAAPYDTTLAGLIGQAANGTWSLYVMDDGNGDQGSIAGGWTLTLTTTGGALAAPPVITTSPLSQVVTVGASVTFTAAASGTPAPTYQWKFNGTAITGATSSTLSLTNVQAANAGNYTLAATNSAGSVTSSAATLTVNPVTIAPVITTQPVSQTVTAGASVTFSGAASGTPAPTFQWKLNGTSISGATSGTLSIANAQAANAGSYTVVATNSAGAITSSTATLTVNSVAIAPVFTSQPASQAVKKGGSVTFAVVVTGSPVPTYQWRKNGIAITGATSASYTISSLTTSSAGTYTVVATNASGAVTSNGAVLTITSATAALTPADFNLDNKTDIIWQNITTGEFSLWLMDGTAADDIVSLGNFDSHWKISGVADFNADGSPDLVCQNTTTGEWSVWLMSGLTVASKVSLGIQPLNSRICGVGDFNGDNRPDIVVQDAVSGQISIWMMSGTQPTSVVVVGTPAANWQVCGAGDFNVDGKSDLVLQNTATGQVNLWYMSGTKVTWKTGLTTVSPEWQVCGTGDFNGDGRSDVLCQDVLTGECSLWIIASNNTVSQKISLGTVSLDWVIRN